MALSYHQAAGLGQASSGDYRHGLGAKKPCCQSCASGGPCEGCGHNQPCKCSSGMSGSTTLIQGSGDPDLEAPPLGYKFVQTTKSGTTVMAKPQGLVPQQRKVDLTRMVEELEFLAGTPGVHPRVLAQRIWEVRRRLMGSQSWQFASYADPTSRYDAKSDLEARLSAVERVLGVDKVSPKIMSALYGMGASGLGGDLSYLRTPQWRETQGAVEKLASCIRGSLCAGSFCCPPDPCRMPVPMVRRAEERMSRQRGRYDQAVTYQETGLPLPDGTWIPEEGGDTWSRFPEDTWIHDPRDPRLPPRDPRLPPEDPRLPPPLQPKETGVPLDDMEKETGVPLEKPITAPFDKQPAKLVVPQAKPVVQVVTPQPKPVVQKPVVQKAAPQKVQVIPGGDMPTAAQVAAAKARQQAAVVAQQQRDRQRAQAAAAAAQQQASFLAQQSRPTGGRQERVPAAVQQRPQQIAQPKATAQVRAAGGYQQRTDMQYVAPAGTDPCAKDPNSWECHASKTDLNQVRAQSLLPGSRQAGSGAQAAAAQSAGQVLGLGRLVPLPALAALQRKLQQTRAQIARRRR